MRQRKNTVRMKEISLEDIRKVEKLLLPEEQTFGDAESERVKIINDLENSCHIVACPGSGKTTVLLAKLLILADRMPFKDNQGICVLTHTNVAIDEIKKRAGTAGDKLFKYPNFFGTIQSFVDRYLAMPSYIKEYKNRIEVIDNDRYRTYFDNYQYTYLAKKAIAYCKRMVKNDYPYSITLSDLSLNTETNTCEKLSLCIDNEDEKKIYDSIKRTKEYALKSGYLTFNDAYYFAKSYLSNGKLKPQLRKSFSQRFKYLFVDEMQDTDIHQIEIIESLFIDTSTKIQYYGDPNQAIFETKVKDTKDGNFWEPEEKNDFKLYKIPDSKRFQNSITCILNKLQVLVGTEKLKLVGNGKYKTKKPVLILFNNGKEGRVINKFAELIDNSKDNWVAELKKDNKKPIYKAIGWVGKDKVEDNIKRKKKVRRKYYLYHHIMHILRKNLIKKGLFIQT